jgi:hypothetical protein
MGKLGRSESVSLLSGIKDKKPWPSGRLSPRHISDRVAPPALLLAIPRPSGGVKLTQASVASIRCF